MNKIFITGGAGFIGSNSSDYFLQQGREVVIFDNLARKGSSINLDWLVKKHGDAKLTFVNGDIRKYESIADAISGSDAVIHLAGQVAVTHSVLHPRDDFEQNALGTFNVLEAVRLNCPDAVFIYASTNKVYGGLEHLGIIEQETRYSYVDLPTGVSEAFPLDFHSPYGCSKGAGDQYTLDYARIYGLRSTVFRQSCIYGQRQFGVEDQGWLAHLIIAVVKNRPIMIFGDGKQVRDVLHISDLIRGYELAIEKSESVVGQAFNIGGGAKNTLSVWREFGPMLAELAGRPVPVGTDDWRPGDQRVFVADIRKARKLLGWEPQVSPEKGIEELYHWILQHSSLFD